MTIHGKDRVSCLTCSMSCLFILGVLLLLIQAIVVPFAAYSQPMYNVIPTDCNSTYYNTSAKNEFTQPWTISGAGFCPVKGSQQKAFVHASTKIKTYVYVNCIPFSEQAADKEWKELDALDKASGVLTDFQGGAVIWTDMYYVLQAAGCVVLLQAASLVACYLISCVCTKVMQRELESNDRAELIFIVIQILLVPVTLGCFVTALLMPLPTDQLKASSWTAYYFHGCSVSIERATGYYGTLYASLVSAVVTLLFVAVTLLYFCTDYLDGLTSDRFTEYKQDRSVEAAGPSGIDKYMTGQETLTGLAPLGRPVSSARPSPAGSQKLDASSRSYGRGRKSVMNLIKGLAGGAQATTGRATTRASQFVFGASPRAEQEAEAVELGVNPMLNRPVRPVKIDSTPTNLPTI